MVRVEDVLGKKWTHHIEGQRLKDETDQFRERLQPTKLFQNWLTEADKVPMVCICFVSPHIYLTVPLLCAPVGGI